MQKTLIILLATLCSTYMYSQTIMKIHNSNGTIDIYSMANIDSITYENLATGTFTDTRDNEVYTTITIGTQTWMSENMRYVTAGSWVNTNSTDPKYGRLYDWYEADSVACPNGWHLPSDAEWKTLEMNLGMTALSADSIDYRGTTEGEQLKSTTDWLNNGNGTNSFGFNVLPTGARNYIGGIIEGTGVYTFFWSSSTDQSYPFIITRSFRGNEKGIKRHLATSPDIGAPCRCLLD